MKKILFVVLLLTLAGCVKDATLTRDQYYEKYGIHELPRRYEYFIVDVEGHKYLVVTNGDNYGGGVGVTHLESCECKN